MKTTANTVTGEQVAATLREIGGLVALEPGNGFRAQAYLRAADALEPIHDISGLVRSGQLTAIPGIGQGLSRVIEELCRTGGSKLLDELRARYPAGTAELSRVLSLPKLRAIHEALGISNLADLRSACASGRIRGLPGFGAKSERALKRIDTLETRRPRGVILPHAARQADAIRAHFARHRAVAAVEIAGDLRRRLETIAALDLVIASDDLAAVAAHAAKLPGAVTVERQREDELVLRQAGGLDARLRLVPPADFAAALVERTGSAAHVAKLGEIARRRGLALDGNGLRRGGRKLRIAGEEQLYARLGLQFVPPELREDAGEIEAAARNTLPQDLLEVDDIQGAVHCHTDASDGRHTIEEMARAAEALGHRYLTITDHSQSATYANGLTVERLRRQADEIARVQELVGIRILHGSEVDILKDGALDYSQKVLGSLDVVIASIHQRHKLDAQQMTDRLVRAMENPLFKIWGHALGRYVLSRPPIECHVEEVLDAVARSRAAIEVNGDPNRLDLAPRWIRAARERGVRFVVSSDAHSTGDLRNVRWGVDMARRGWLRKDDVLNTQGPDEFTKTVRPKTASGPKA